MEKDKEELYTEKILEIQDVMDDKRLTKAEKVGILEAVKFDLLASTCLYKKNQ